MFYSAIICRFSSVVWGVEGIIWRGLNMSSRPHLSMSHRNVISFFFTVVTKNCTTSVYYWNQYRNNKIFPYAPFYKQAR